MDNLIPVTKCPKCGNTTIEEPAFSKANLDDHVRCPACRQFSRKGDFFAEILDKSAKLFQDLARDIPGFKPK